MIQFNLLPDVKIKYIKSRRQKRTVVLISSLVGIGSLGIVVLMGVYVFAVQGLQIANYSNQIKKSSESIKNKQSQVDDINKVLTVQNQLGALDTLHAEKPIRSRIFDYLSKLTPSQITIAQLDLDSGEGLNNITIEGSTDTLETVNKFVDTLKFTRFKLQDQIEDEDYTGDYIFTEVVLVNFSRDKEGASYTVKFTYNPIIFSSTEKVDALLVPQGLTTTRSALGRPIIQTDTEQQNNAPEEE